MAFIRSIALLAACLVSCASLAADPPAPGQSWTDLFNGRDLNGWINVNCAPSTWTVRDGMIVCSGRPTGLLRTQKTYENFVLEMEWRHMNPQGNAGLFVWSDPLTVRGQPFSRAIEVQVMIGAEGEWYTSDGDIFPIHGAAMEPEEGHRREKGGNRAFPNAKRTNGAGEWNHYRVECNDGRISLAVNGEIVTRGRNCSPRIGYICLESEGSEVHFRNLRIRELPSSGAAMDDPATRIEMDTGFRPLFNGVDFSGWKFTDAHKDHWKADDWTIQFDGQGEDLWTEESFADFVLIADWRWTSKPRSVERPIIGPDGQPMPNADGTPKLQTVQDAGDSGIYLRGSSKSQVNIWNWPVGSGEVWGYRTDPATPPDIRASVTPKVRADAPIGQWNRFIITMKGDRLTVVLNGQTVIDDAKLPGIAKTGPIALQKHGDAIQFGNIYIKRLD